MYHPFSDLIDTPESFIVKLDAPGFTREDFDISVTENTLDLFAERKEEKQKEQRKYIQHERRYGSISRSMMLPAKIKPEEVSATYKKGVLTITMPKKVPEAKKTKVPVKST
ncbi:MAG: Hsp20 family protein [Candidatus Korarchaeota archaeon]|nr:Hsp20 family protein [Candidatus Thorarchaeota archaeon]NIW52154.1 Hsp20 family protein [Candidatus Korarchaeota archaeon]